MSNRRNSLLILGFVAVCIAVAVYVIFVRQPVSEATQLGLDLEGGVSVQLEGYRTDGTEVEREEMELASEVIRERVDSLGVTEPEIRLQGQEQVSVNIPGITDSDRAVELVGRTAQLGFYEVLDAEGQPAVPEEQVDEVREEIRADLEGSSEYEEGSNQVLFSESPAREGQGVDVEGLVLTGEPQITGGALDQASLDRDEQGNLQVLMEFNNQGAQEFGDLSQEISENALAAGQPGAGRLAIVLDEDVESAPTVEQRIDGGSVVINNPGLPGGLPQQEAEELEIVLQTGALPINMEVLSVQTIGPTLGAASLTAGLTAAAVGFGLVLGFLLTIYRVLGVVASIALLIYAFLLWGLIAGIPITITLPGIAGIALALGVAADANIVIFERIKEEVRRGKTPRSAIQVGYQKGFRAILDGNVTTLITALILFALSTGSVRGFAVLLSVGVVLSMFTAVLVTRALLGLLASRGFVDLTPGMMGVSGKEPGEVEPAEEREPEGVR